MSPEKPDDVGIPTGDYVPTDNNAPIPGEPLPPPGKPIRRTREQAGDRIGPYKLLQKLGEGGMGAVWQAEQSAPVRRLVALKLIRPDLAADHFLARFEAERQALAMMDHPNISKVFDAGTIDNGAPYLVMELVKGVPLTKYCDDARLTLRERVQLFVPVCRAVQHAHTKGIIHRDLKPSNILVALYDGVAVPKIIDFGIAKALHQRLTEKTLVTEFGSMVGTPEYMAPEQAELNALDIDTRADIYSLGTILYELLAGSTPFDRRKVQGHVLLELLRLIKETEPLAPSKKLSSIDTLPDIAARRKCEPQKLGRLVRGELDWIVMKALEKERTRRYATAEGFAGDLEHFLNDEPVEASPPSAVYRVRKVIRKRKGLVIGLCLSIVASAVGLMLWIVRERAIVDRLQVTATALTAELVLVELGRTGELAKFEKDAENPKGSQIDHRTKIDSIVKSAMAAIKQVQKSNPELAVLTENDIVHQLFARHAGLKRAYLATPNAKELIETSIEIRVRDTTE